MSNFSTFNPHAHPEAAARSLGYSRHGWGPGSDSWAGSGREGHLTQMLEQQTSRVPSDAWLWAAAGSMGLSLYYQATHRPHKALFVGQWAPTFLLLGIYNKLVKLHGSE